jgi:hypothetical protein
MMDRREFAGQIVGGVHQCNVRKGLRKVTGLALQPYVVFLREQTDVIAQVEDTLGRSRASAWRPCSI